MATNINEMTDEELRLEIAKAKGWEEGYIGKARLVVPPEGDPRRVWAAEWDDNGFPHWMENWPASIALSWELVEDAEAHDIHFKMSNVIPNSDPAVYEFVFYGYGGSWGGEGYTAPVAICRAWLEWKKFQSENKL